MGGNVRIKDYETNSIDLNKFERFHLNRIIKSLGIFNDSFKRKTTKTLWEISFLSNGTYFSGSSRHLFDTNHSIDYLLKIKPTFGDIDIMVDEGLYESLKSFLESVENIRFGDLTFLGFKTGNKQLISLFRFELLKVNIQIDFEFVEFENAIPTSWSVFSHCSLLNDMEFGIKGVFHKYLLRALTAKSYKRFPIIRKNQVGFELTNEYAFSVTLGLRNRLQYVEEQKAYRVLKPSESVYTKDLYKLFEYFFNEIPSTAFLVMMFSFIDTCSLIDFFINEKEQQIIFDGFLYTLWGDVAQCLYREDFEKDKKEKEIAVSMLLELCPNIVEDKQKINEMKNKYYDRLKQV